MLRTSALLLAILFLAGCGGGTMPFTPSHSGTSGGSGSSTSGSGTSSAGSGTSSSGSSGSGTFSSASSGSGTSSSGTSSSGSSGSGSSSSTVGPSEFTFAGYTWETHNGSAPPVGNVN